MRHLRAVLRSSALTGAALVIVACESSSGGGGGAGGGGGIGGSGGGMVCDPMPEPLVCTGDPATDYFAQFVSWLAAWDDTGGPGAVRVDLHIELYGAEGDLSFADDPTASGGSLGSVTLSAQTLSFYVTPDATPGSGGAGGAGGSSGGAGGSSGGTGGSGGGTPAAGPVHLTIPLSCNSVAEQLKLRVEPSGPPTNGQAVTIQPDE
jgi:hypothetical protein